MSAAGAATGGSSLLGAASGLGGFGTNVIDSLGLAATGFGQAAAATFSNGLIAGFSTNMANIGALASGGSIATAFGAAVPYIGAVLAVGSIAKSLFDGGGGRKTESTYGAGYAPLGNTGATGLAGTYARGVEDAWTVLAKQLNLSTQLKVGAQTSVDTQGDAQTIFDANASINGTTVSSRYNRLGSAENVGRSDEALQAAMAEEMTRMLFAALKASDLPEQYKTYLNGIADDVASMSTAMSNVTVVSDFNKALQSLPFENLKNLSFDAAYGLIQFAGGMEALGANLGTYYTNFYSAEEQRVQAIKNINAATAGSGLDAATASRESFRALVEAQDLTTESGQRTYAALIGVSGAFAELTPVLGAVADAIDANLAKMQDSAAELAVELLQAQGDMAGAASAQRALDTAGYSDLAVAQYDANTATRALIDELNAQAAAADQLAASQAQLAATNKQWQDQLDVLTGAQTERSLALRDATDDSTRALMLQVYAQQAAADIASERQGLQDQLDQLTMTSTQLLEKQRNALDGSNRALFDQIQTLTAAKAAAQAVTSAAGAASDAYSAAVKKAQQVLDYTIKRQTASLNESVTAYQNAGDAMRKFRDDLSATMAGFISPQMTTTLAANQYGINVAKAKLGDKDAMQAFSGLANDYLKASLASSSTAVDYQRVMATVLGDSNLSISAAERQIDIAEKQLAALEKLASGDVPKRYQYTASADFNATLNSIPNEAGTLNARQAYDNVQYAKQDISYFAAGSAPNLPRYNQDGSSANNAAVVAELKALRAEMATANRVIALNTAKMARISTKWDDDGQPAVRTA
jgi:FtsZ-binding cell division protein ZapB